jgi:hypothetical protein
MRRLRRAVKKAANAVADAVNKAADAVADVVETIGNVIGDSLTRLGERIPVVGGVLGWLGGVVSAATTLAGAIVKGAGAIVGGVLSGVIKIAGGLLTLDLRGTLEGLLDIGSGVGGAVLVIGGAAIALVQEFFMIGQRRRLNAEERRLIRLVFHNSIAMYNARVVDDFSGLFSLTSQAFVLGNTIHMKGSNATDSPGLFVHECVHVWQNQHHGSRYTAEALASQKWGMAYNWEQPADAGLDWTDFGREAQARLIQDVFDRGGMVHGPAGNGAFFAESDDQSREFIYRRIDRTALANDAARSIRGRTPWRLSTLFN